jgi:hypothetical protein
MAGVKITDLDSAFGAPAIDDVLIIVDTSTNLTKQIRADDLLLGQTAEKANTILVSTDTTSTEAKIHFGNGASGTYDSVGISNSLTYDAATGSLTALAFEGNGSALTDLPQNDPVVNAVDAGTDANPYYIMIRNSATGLDSVHTQSNLTSNPNTGVLTTPFFAGNGSLLTGVLADSATNADSANFATEATHALYADSATQAASALFALNATQAVNADSATVATSSLTSALATFALAADSAASASNAVQAQYADTIATTTAASETTLYPFMGTAQTGLQATLAADAALTYNASNGRLSSTAFSGDGSLLTNLPIPGGGSIANALNVLPSAVDASHSILFVQSATGVDSVNTDAGLLYNPLSNLLTAGAFSGEGKLLTEVPAVKINSNFNPTTGTQYIMLKASQTGSDSVSTDGGIVFDAGTNTLTATNLAGNGSNITDVAAVSATNAANIAITTINDSATYYVHLGSAASGNDNTNVDLNLTYNPLQNLLNSGIAYTTDSAGLWNGAAPTTLDSAVNRFAILLKTLNSQVGA